MSGHTPWDQLDHKDADPAELAQARRDVKDATHVNKAPTVVEFAEKICRLIEAFDDDLDVDITTTFVQLLETPTKGIEKASFDVEASDRGDAMPHRYYTVTVEEHS